MLNQRAMILNNLAAFVFYSFLHREKYYETL